MRHITGVHPGYFLRTILELVTDAGIACLDIQDRVLGQSICDLLDEMGADTFVVWDTSNGEKATL